MAKQDENNERYLNGLRKVGDHFEYRFQRDGKRYGGTILTSSRQEAEQHLESLRKRATRPSNPGVLPPITLKKLGEMLVHHLLTTNDSIALVEEVRQVFIALAPLHRTPIDRISAWDIPCMYWNFQVGSAIGREMKRRGGIERIQGCRPQPWVQPFVPINRTLRILRMALRFAVRQGLIPKMPDLHWP